MFFAIWPFVLYVNVSMVRMAIGWNPGVAHVLRFEIFLCIGLI